MIKLIFFGVIEGFLRNLSGPVGRKLRFIYYKRRFASCGKNVYIDEGVIFNNPEFMHIGTSVWIDKYVVMIAGKSVDKSKENVKHLNQNIDVVEGYLKIGSYSHIGIHSIIQAHAGVEISDYFTSSAGCKIYSISNDYKKSQFGVMKSKFYIASPIKIHKNVWLGLNSIVLGGEIEDDVFVAPNSIVTKSIEKNSVASGNPAIKIKYRFDPENMK